MILCLTRSTKKTLAIINSRIDFLRDMERKTLELTNETSDDEYRHDLMTRYHGYCEREYELRALKTQLKLEIGY